MKKKLRRQQPRRSLLETFLQLCSMTTPEGNESYCWHLLPKGDDIDWYIDQNNNVHIYVYNKTADGRLYDSRVMWSCHLDTADSFPTHVVFLRSEDNHGNEIIGTDSSSILGADCKIGAAIMIKMIEARIPGWYAFFAGEESGRIGSNGLAHRLADKKKDSENVSLPDICISFDRYGTDEIITHQMGRRTCSQTFALALASIFNRHPMFKYEPSDRGSYTDSYSFCGLVSECTNISVGYNYQHTCWEEQNITHAIMLLNTILAHRALFEVLPADRDPRMMENKSYGFVPKEDILDTHYGKGSTSSDPTKASESSGGTGQLAPASGSAGTQNAASRSPSGTGSDTRHGTGGKMGVGSSQWGRARKLTRAEKKHRRREEGKLRRQRRLGHTSSEPESKGNSSKELIVYSRSGKTEQTSTSRTTEGTDRYPILYKSEEEVRQVPTKPYQGYLKSVKRVVPTIGHQLYDPLDDSYETQGYSHGGVSSSSTSDGHDDSSWCLGADKLDDHLFSEQQMAYEKGELNEREEETFLIDHLKRGGGRDSNDGVHKHGRVVSWYECTNCETVEKQPSWEGYDTPVRCSDCGELIELKILRYDSDIKLYVPTTGDITDAIPPHLIP